MATDEQIDAVTERLREAAPDAVVILFGSHARGDAEEGSDLDLLVVAPQVESSYTETVRLERSLNGIDASTDIIVVDRETYEKWADEPCTVVHAAARDGRILHAPPGCDLRLRPEHRREAAPDATMILFGPYAQGRPRPTSDLDILVVEPEVKSMYDEMVRLEHALRGSRVATDIIVVSTADYRDWAGRAGPVCPLRSTWRRSWPRRPRMSRHWTRCWRRLIDPRAIRRRHVAPKQSGGGTMATTAAARQGRLTVAAIDEVNDAWLFGEDWNDVCGARRRTLPGRVFERTD